MSQYLQGIATVLSLINPAICAAMFTSVERGRSRRSKLGDATTAAAAILVILGVSSLFGSTVLRIFGISLDAFQVAGGLVLSWMGFSMLRGPGPKAPEEGEGSSGKGATITPLVLFAASPGTITGVITLSVAHSRYDLPVTALTAIGTAVVLTWGVLALTARASGTDHNGGLVHDVITRFMGLVVLAMGVQFALAGARTFFAVR